MADLALRFQLQRRFIGSAAPVFFKPLCALGVHQVEIEIIHPAGFQLGFKQGPNVLLLFKKVIGQLVGQNVPIPRIPGSQTGSDSLLALATDVAVGGIKIVKSRRQKGVHHLRGLGNVHQIAHHGQAHHTKAEPLLNFGKHRFHIHISLTFCCRNALR